MAASVGALLETLAVARPPWRPSTAPPRSSLWHRIIRGLLLRPALAAGRCQKPRTKSAKISGRLCRNTARRALAATARCGSLRSCRARRSPGAGRNRPGDHQPRTPRSRLRRASTPTRKLQTADAHHARRHDASAELDGTDTRATTWARGLPRAGARGLRAGHQRAAPCDPDRGLIGERRGAGSAASQVQVVRRGQTA